jgi:tetratricopeptide (TPR) repeat protein
MTWWRRPGQPGDGASAMIRKFFGWFCAALVAAIAVTIFVQPSLAFSQSDAQDCGQTVDLDRTLAGCTKVLALKNLKAPLREGAFVVRGRAFAMKGDVDHAIADYNEAIRINPKGSLAITFRGAAYHVRGDYDHAIADYDEAIRIDPKNATAYSNRGITFAAKNDDDRAVADYNEAIRIEPAFAAPHISRANIYWKKHDYDRALDDLSEAIRIDPKLAAAHDNRGQIYFAKGDVDRAITDYGEAIRVDPRFANAYNHRGKAYYDKADYGRALDDLSEAIRINPTLGSACLRRANIYAARGDYQRAIADYNEAIRLDPLDPEPLTGRGLVYEKTAEIAKARADFNAALNAAQRSDTEKSAKETARERLSALSDVPAAAAAAMAPAPTAAAPSTASVPTSDHRIALVIGNSAYERVPALLNPVRDAAFVAETLKRTGFESVTVLTNLRKDALISALREFAARTEHADWAVVYYAGHGMEVGGINYLVPVDARIAADRDISFEAVPLEQVLNAAERAKKLRLVILDACRDNPFASQMKRTLTVASRSVTRGLAAIEPEAGTLVVYAAKDGETAIDGDGDNSPFALAFVKNLQTPGLEVRRLFDYVRDDVMEATSRKQKPFSYGSISGRQDFYFVAGK